LDAVSRNPDVARWATELEAREAALVLERSRAVPDVTLSAGPRVFTDSGQVAAVVELGLPLPLFDRNQGNVAAASSAGAVAAAQRRAAITAVRAALGRNIDSLRAAYARATALRDGLIPAAQRTYTGAQEAYRRGALRNLEVLDARRAWFELRDAYLEALVAYHAARIEVERLLGADLEAAAGGSRCPPLPANSPFSSVAPLEGGAPSPPGRGCWEGDMRMHTAPIRLTRPRPARRRRRG